MVTLMNTIPEITRIIGIISMILEQMLQVLQNIINLMVTLRMLILNVILGSL